MIPDKKYDKRNFLIHDYFFARTIDKVRPGGTDVYSHIIDEDRRINADKLEQAFYSGDSVKTPDSIIPENVTAPEKKETDEQTLLRLLSNPDMAALIKNLAANL